MPHVVTQSCCSDASCVVACPVNCIHPAPGDPDFATAEMLYVDAANVRRKLTEALRYPLFLLLAATCGMVFFLTFVLPQFLQARARNAANTNTTYTNMGSSAAPLNLLSWSAPISNDAVTLEFSQLVNANDPLRTGTYSKALTFTLSTTTP